jgi:hypothetical protein
MGGSIVRKNQQCLVDKLIRYEQLDAAHSAAHIDTDANNHCGDTCGTELDSGQVAVYLR